MLLLGNAAHVGGRGVVARGDAIVVLLLSSGSGGGGGLRLGVLLRSMVGMGLMVGLRPVGRRVLILVRKDVLAQHVVLSGGAKEGGWLSRRGWAARRCASSVGERWRPSAASEDAQ